MVVATSAIPRPINMNAMNSQMPSELKEALLAKLKSLDPETLNQLQNSFYEAASGSAKLPMNGATAAFGCKTPTEAILAGVGMENEGYFQTLTRAMSKGSVPDTMAKESSEAKPANGKDDTPQKQVRTPKTYGAQTRTPGIFSNPSADKAAEALRQQQTQTLNFIANQLGPSFTKGDMSQFLGPNVCFEDALAEMLFRIADKDQRDLMEQLRDYERSDSGLKGMVANGAKSLAGAAGGAVGGYLSSSLGGSPGVGAAVGYDIGEKIAGSVTGQYGSSSKAAQFERIKLKVSEMTQCIQMLSNVLHSFDTANKNTISNMRG